MNKTLEARKQLIGDEFKKIMEKYNIDFGSIVICLGIDDDNDAVFMSMRQGCHQCLIETLEEEIDNIKEESKDEPNHDKHD